MNTTEKKQTERYQFLRKVFDLADGETGSYFDMFADVGRPLGFTEEKVLNIVQYLTEEGLLTGFIGGFIGISHLGLKEVEESITQPEKKTEHFSPVNIIHINNMANSVIQQGNINSSVVATINVNDLKELEDFLKDFKQFVERAGVAFEQRAELLSEIATANVQLQSPKPKKIILKEILKSLWSISLSVGANFLTPLLKERFTALLHYFS